MRPSQRHCRLTMLGMALSLAGVAVPGQAQSFPVKPIRMIVGFPPGGVVDIVARGIAQPMSELLGQTVLVDSRPGAAGTIGLTLLNAAPPDGYTIGLASISNLVLAPHLNPKITYHPVRDFTPITNVGRVPFVLAVNPTVPAKSLKELIALARAQPGKLNFGSPGVGGLQHLTIGMLNFMAKTDITHVAYKGTGPAMADVLGGQIDGVVAGISGMVAASKAGKLRILAQTGDTRSPALPDVPTAQEQGLPGMVVLNWYSFIGPPKLTGQPLATLYSTIVKAAHLPATRERFDAAGIDVKTDDSPAAFGRYVAEEDARWGQVVKTTGIKME
jgi:tripartite-type tricarboxylate transporter receptor subunit TctC